MTAPPVPFSKSTEARPITLTEEVLKRGARTSPGFKGNMLNSCGAVALRLFTIVVATVAPIWAAASAASDPSASMYSLAQVPAFALEIKPDDIAILNTSGQISDGT